MVSKYEMIEYMTKACKYTYDEDSDVMTNVETGSRFLLNKFLDSYRESTGESFECIYDDHVSLFNILKCTKCGTYIFSRYDEDYDPNLKCPTCVDYKTYFKYYTKEDIAADPNKEREIQMYYEFARIEREADERYVKRGNLYDWQITKRYTLFKNANHKITAQVISNSKKTYNMEICLISREDLTWVYKKKISIPLTLRSIIHKIKLSQQLRKYRQANN